jgi:hypothetical protein
MIYEADRQDLARHVAEISVHVTFNYAVLNHDETELLGCLYIDPPGERTRMVPTRWSHGGWSTASSAASSNSR